MISETNRYTREIENLNSNNRDVSLTVTMRITTPRGLDADKKIKKFIQKRMKDLKEEFKDFCDDLNDDLEF